MSDEIPTPQDRPEAPAAVPQAGATAAGRRLAALAMAGLGGVLLLQVAGLLLRDSLERRQPVLAEAPTVVGESAEAAAGGGPVGTRFGPEVREVVVAAPATPAPAPVPVPVPVPVPAPAPAPVPVPVPVPLPTPVPPAIAEPIPAPQQPADAPAAADATHALQVGLFGSQRYRADMERQLQQAGFPHFRRQSSKPGEGYRLMLPLPTAAQEQLAREALASAEVLFSVQDGTLEAWFYFEAEAQRALERLSKAGLKGGYAKSSGELPLWVVYAGPYSLAEAKQARERLAVLGLPSYLRKAP